MSYTTNDTWMVRRRRTGKIKGIERFLGAVDTLQESLIEVTSGQAKYEHQHRAIVWRMPRLPKEGQGSALRTRRRHLSTDLF